ncbi:MAG TPA: N-6 DNA methylase [Steroidobacteraceae bacterium]|nr:N-6 DNA methylase [Steroidobacteraceae bacterium]
MLEQYVGKIEAITRQARSETSLQIKLEVLLSELLASYDISYEPSVNETLKAQGFSQVDSTRPDSLFGHVVLDYKAPHLLSSVKEFQKAKQQIEGYLNNVTSNDLLIEGQKWAGVLWDGASLSFCHSTGTKWSWTVLFEVSESSLLTLIGTYRALQRKALTASMLAHAFGKDSDVARAIITTMCSHLSKPRHRTTMLFREWKRLFEQVSTYGLDQLPTLKVWARSLGIATKDASQILFAIHSYYALVVKFLTSEMLAAVNPTSMRSHCEAIANAPNSDHLYKLLSDLEDGEYWRKYRISNFLEGDFFSWYTNEHSKALATSIQNVAREMLKFEPATAIVKPEAIKDLLKEFYTTLVDEQIRHDLGEYYTPDWLAQRVLDCIDYTGDLNATVLDPACGSGTFLLECITRIRRRASAEGIAGRKLLHLLLQHVKGMDLNPLAVISARANFILSTADLVFTVGDDVEIPIYLADCINVPSKNTAADNLTVLEFSLDTELGNYELQIPNVLVEAKLLGKVLLACEDAIKEGRSATSFLTAVRALPGIKQVTDDRVERRMIELFEIVASLEERDWNRIWCRIVKNSFSPNGFIGQVDFVIGNPPWVRWSRLPQLYRNRVKAFCNYYGLVSGKGYSGGIESDISTVVLYSSVDHWLRVGGRIGLLMTWTVFKSGSATGFRLGRLPDNAGIRTNKIADLRRIQPFPDATNETSIYIGTKVASFENAIFSQIPAETWIPKKSPRTNPLTNLQDVLSDMTIVKGVACPVSAWGSPLWTGDKNAFRESRLLRGQSSYLRNAHRGTISDLARVYWVKVERYARETNRALIRTLRSDELPKARQVDPVEGAWIEADLLYPLMRGRDLGRYSSDTDQWYQIIPNAHYEKVVSEEDFAEQYPCAYSYFSNYRDLLVNRSTYKRYQKHLPFYVIYCVGDYSFSKCKMAWMEQQDPASFRCAVISDCSSSLIPNKNIVPDHKLYFADLDTPEEAHYLSGYLNSHPVRTWLGGFLHGKQIGTTIFEFMNVPQFNPTLSDHCRIAAISLAAHSERLTTPDTSFLAEDQEAELTALVRRIASALTMG